jgi:DNA-binding response OmpR family regulator
MSKRILIADDDVNIRHLIRRQLTESGYEVFEADSGMGASLWLSLHYVDLVITDVVMPDMDGIELAYSIKHRYPNMPIIAISAGEHIMSKELCLRLMQNLGAVETLSKPFNLPHLVKTVESLLGNQEPHNN